jgi:uncharacterized repeat protein (TIGR01451 family)
LYICFGLVFVLVFCGTATAAEAPNGNSTSGSTSLTTEQKNQATQQSTDQQNKTTPEQQQATPDTTPQSTNEIQAASDPSGVVIFTENYKLDPAQKPLYYAQVGEITTFSTWVLNYGPDTATGLYITEPIPDGLQYIDHISRQADGSYSKTAYNPTTGRWDIGTMKAQSSWYWVTDVYPNMFITVRVLRAGTYFNIGTAYSDNYPPASQTSTIIVNPSNLPDLTPTNLQISSTTPTVGSSYQVTYTVSNMGQTAANNFNVNLSDGASLVGQQTISLAPGASTNISFTWTPTTSGQHTLTAQVDTTNTITESNENNNTITTNTTVNPANNNGLTGLEIYSASNQTIYYAQIGQQITITTWVLNYGSDMATGMYAIQKLPDGLQYIGNYTNVGTYNSTTGTWTIGSMNRQSDWVWPRDAGKYPYMYLTVKVLQPGTYINLATLYSDNYLTVSNTPTYIIVNP